MKPNINNLLPGKSTAADVLACLGEAEKTTEGATLGKVSELTLLGYYKVGVSVYLKKNIIFAVIYALDAAPEANSFAKLTKDWGTPTLDLLPSSVQKNARVYFFEKQGTALHADHGKILLVEKFGAMTATTYQRDIYKQPPLFKK